MSFPAPAAAAVAAAADGGYGTMGEAQPAADEEDLSGITGKLVMTDIPVLAVPWIVFLLVLLPFALARGYLLGALALALCGGLSFGFLALSRGRAWQLLAWTCALSVGLGVMLGQYDRVKYLKTYQLYARSPSYENVLPTTHPGALRDAAFFEFSADARVDAAKGAGYMSGELWCAAPVVGRTRQDRIGFWAVGTNCCKARGLFQCGDVWNLTKHSAMVVMDSSPLLFPEIPLYLKAAQVASAAYGFPPPDNPIFVLWDTDFGAALQDMWGEATSFASTAAMIYLVVVPIFLLLLKLFGLALTDRERSTHWNAEMVDAMTFGVEFIPRIYPQEFQFDLQQQRCYWSGEVLFDYAFHFANKHVFAGIFFSHPAHPYTKWRRLVIGLVTSVLVIFASAAFSEKAGYSSLFRFVLILAAATLPKNIMKLQLMQIARQGAEIRLEDGRNMGPSPHAVFLEFGFLGLCLLLTAVVCAVCVQSIKSSTSQPLGTVLGKNMDALGFVFILEPLVDLLTPYFGHGELEGVWALGFFGRWRMERNQLEGPPKDFEIARGTKRRLKEQGFWTSTEQEVFGLGLPAFPRNARKLCH